MNRLLAHIIRPPAVPAKAMVDQHPEVLDRVHVITVQQGQQPLPDSYNYLSALGDYTSHTWVRKAINVIGNNFAPLPVGVVRAGERVESHLLSQLLVDMNDKMSSGDVWGQWAVDMLLGGEEFWELTRIGSRYAEVWPRQPHTVLISPDKAGMRYQQVVEYVVDDGLGKPYPLPPDEMIHFKFYNPRNPWRGIAPITAIRLSIIIDQFAQMWSRMFFANSARPDYALITPQGLTAEERDDLEKKLTLKFGGTENWHKPIILEEAVTDIKTLSHPPKDLMWLQQRDMARQEIGAIFGVPDGIMGWGEESYDTATKLEGDMRALWAITLVPLAGLRDITLTEFFRRNKALAPGEAIVTDLSGVGVLKQDRAGQLMSAKDLFSMGYPVNVINEYLGLGLPDIPGGDVGYLPFGLAPIGSAPPASPSSAAPKRIRAKGHPGYSAKSPEYGSDAHRGIWEYKDARLDKYREEMEELLEAEISRQQRDALRRLQSGKTSATIIHIPDNGHLATAAALAVVKLGADDVFDLDDEVAKFKDTFKSVLRRALIAVGKDELAAVGVDDPFDGDSPAARGWIKKLLDSFATKTNDTTYNELAAVFDKIAEDGVGLKEQMDRLNVFFEGRKSPYQLERTSRTTMTGVNAAGDNVAWEQSGLVEERAWLTEIDGRERDAHRAAHGQQVGLDETYTVGGEELEFPGDPNGSAENIINCRCSQVPIF